MDYDETMCQLCGVSFAIARHRRADEPLSAAWDCTGSTYGSDRLVELFNENCGNLTGCGCELLEGEASRYQHIAGPECVSDDGYSGHRISIEEMKGCRAVQALVKKREGWEPEDDDEDFEIKSKYFLTGVGDGSPDGILLNNIKPARHGIDHMNITNRDCSFEELVGFPRDFAVQAGSEQWWCHKPGSEYLVANPVKIPGLHNMLKGVETGFASKLVFDRAANAFESSGADPFTTLSMEIISMVIEYLSSNDIANLRLTTRAVQQLPDILFRRLLLEDMPWMWEAEDLPRGRVNWHNLYCSVKFGWVGLKGIRNRIRIWKDVEEIVSRIEKHRRSKRDIE